MDWIGDGFPVGFLSIGILEPPREINRSPWSNCLPRNPIPYGASCWGWDKRTGKSYGSNHKSVWGIFQVNQLYLSILWNSVSFKLQHGSPWFYVYISKEWAGLTISKPQIAWFILIVPQWPGQDIPIVCSSHISPIFKVNNVLHS